ncbi:hypothetical protein [Hydrogenophaga pseudoflava]|uniref:hypothetical protein n=1 Tax=Hydrogenophaga pseudoflava TaxID=47421 RepID=UPI0027E4C163|nr:hypothetical protein [Hydrogenophaga pseudoflava]MDQ7746952.1 hypothetical protein [Hydrogenophaga pseudoflava]
MDAHHHPLAQDDATGDEEYLLPSVDALMAGTFALMTGYAQAGAECPNRGLIVKKLVSNLFFLANHPEVAPPMRCMLGNLRTRWQILLEETGAHGSREPVPTALWHTAPGALQ